MSVVGTQKCRRDLGKCCRKMLASAKLQLKVRYRIGGRSKILGRRAGKAGRAQEWVPDQKLFHRPMKFNLNLSWVLIYVARSYNAEEARLDFITAIVEQQLPQSPSAWPNLEFRPCRK